MVSENPDDFVPNRTWSTDRLIDQAKEYLDSVSQHRTKCRPESQSGRGKGCAGYNHWVYVNMDHSCAEDFSFLYGELGRIYTILAERE
jgi:dTDP-D-glucose 4,6-dehydratase